VSPFGYHSLQFSREGKQLIGATAASDQEGLTGDFRYLFWSANGQPTGSVTLEGRRIGIPDEQGDSIVFLGESNAAAFRMDGIPLWTVKGKYLKGTLANAGNTALLSPASEVEAVHVVQSGALASASIRMLAPVHELAMTPDGSLGAVATRAGRISIVDLQSCTTGSCAVRQLPQLPILSTHYITAIRFISRDAVVIGVIQATGRGRDKRFYGGAVLVLKTTGELVYQRSMGFRELTTWSPKIDVAFGNPVFAAYTPNTAIFVRLDN